LDDSDVIRRIHDSLALVGQKKEARAQALHRQVAAWNRVVRDVVAEWPEDFPWAIGLVGDVILTRDGELRIQEQSGTDPTSVEEVIRQYGFRELLESLDRVLRRQIISRDE
jgi:hypothetical protein